jgi:hypothetical protein
VKVPSGFRSAWESLVVDWGGVSIVSGRRSMPFLMRVG